jgi:hypothetical protein
MFHPLTQNTIKAFKFRAQAIFSVLEKNPPPPVYTPCISQTKVGSMGHWIRPDLVN